MKLFKRLLVAPATLGLLAPLAVSASEVNMNDVANYSRSFAMSSATFDNDSSAACLPISGLAPAPNPLVNLAPN